MIDYKLLHEASEYYEKLGYQHIEVPWTVTEAVSRITKPEGKIDFQLLHNGKVLVASAEQSFLYLYLKGYIPKGKFFAITPCYRFEEYDFLHKKTFMKAEIINTISPNEKTLEVMVGNALSFYQRFIPEAEVVKTDEGFDIEWNKMELGSYGIRSCQFLKWVYGTGVSEPRCSDLIKLRNRE